jgi:hypothetical protein
MVTITEAGRTSMFRTLPPDTGAQIPDAKQLRSLRKIVAAAHPWIGGDISVDSEESDREFATAFRAVGRFFRLEAPDETRSFGWIIDQANARLSEQVSGPMFLAACLASGDVVWRRGDTSVGQLLTVGLNPFRGLKANNRWLAILSGTGNILSPAPPRSEVVQRAARGVLQATFWEKGTNGMRQINARDPLWVRSRS